MPNKTKKKLFNFYKQFYWNNIVLCISTIISFFYIFGEISINIIGICLSILIGLLFNLLVLVISSINSDKFSSHTSTDKRNRLNLTEEVYSDVTLAIISSLICLGTLFSQDILSFKLLVGNIDLGQLFQYYLRIGIFFTLIESFIILFQIIQKLKVLFLAEIMEEHSKINQIERDELDNWEDLK